MDLSSKGVTVCVVEPDKRSAYQPTKHLLCMNTSKSYGVKMTFKELQDTEVWGEDILGHPLLFKSHGLIRGQEFHCSKEWVGVAIYVRFKPFV